jgi:NAD(P)H-hydrate epimerase
MNTLALKNFFHRPVDSYKYQFGHVLVIGGTPGMVGAPFLAAKSALRSGSGLVTIASHPEVIDKLEKRIVEIMTVRIADQLDTTLDIILSYIAEHKVNTLVVGPGLATEDTSIILPLLHQTNLPTVIDGGALLPFQNNLAELTAIGQKNDSIILTPHAGEFTKLTGILPPKNQTALEKIVVVFAKSHSVTLVYKVHHTLIAHPDGSLYQNNTGNPGMATAGSGDVLAGIIGGLLAQKLTATEASEFGVYAHGLAGDLASNSLSQPGLIASDIITYLPQAWLTMSNLG